LVRHANLITPVRRLVECSGLKVFEQFWLIQTLQQS